MSSKDFLKLFKDATDLELATKATTVELEQFIGKLKAQRATLTAELDKGLSGKQLFDVNTAISQIKVQLTKANRVLNMIHFDNKQRKVAVIKRNITEKQAIDFYLAAQEYLETSTFNTIRIRAGIK